MAPTKAKGDLAELKVAADLVAKGYSVSLPFGEDCDYDLVPLIDKREGSPNEAVHAGDGRLDRRLRSERGSLLLRAVERAWACRKSRAIPAGGPAAQRPANRYP